MIPGVLRGTGAAAHPAEVTTTAATGTVSAPSGSTWPATASSSPGRSADSPPCSTGSTSRPPPGRGLSPARHRPRRRAACQLVHGVHLGLGERGRHRAQRVHQLPGHHHRDPGRPLRDQELVSEHRAPATAPLGLYAARPRPVQRWPARRGAGEQHGLSPEYLRLHRRSGVGLGIPYVVVGSLTCG